MRDHGISTQFMAIDGTICILVIFVATLQETGSSLNEAGYHSNELQNFVTGETGTGLGIIVY